MSISEIELNNGRTVWGRFYGPAPYRAVNVGLGQGYALQDSVGEKHYIDGPRGGKITSRREAEAAAAWCNWVNHPLLTRVFTAEETVEAERLRTEA